MELNKKAAYLQGLVDGLGIDDTTKEGKIIKAMSALLGEMAEVIESVDEDLSRAYDQINDLSEELEDLEADLYEDDDDEEDYAPRKKRGRYADDDEVSEDDEMAERIIHWAPPITAIVCALIIAVSLVYHFVLA